MKKEKTAKVFGTPAQACEQKWNGICVQPERLRGMGCFWTQFRFCSQAGQYPHPRSVPPNLPRFSPFSSPPQQSEPTVFPPMKSLKKETQTAQTIPNISASG
jgi:hypothetical protein